MEELEAAYPEASPYTRRAVEEHGEEWVIQHYAPQITQLGQAMDVPPVEELPFFDEAEKRDRADAYGAYLKNVRSGTKPGEE